MKNSLDMLLITAVIFAFNVTIAFAVLLAAEQLRRKRWIEREYGGRKITRGIITVLVIAGITAAAEFAEAAYIWRHSQTTHLLGILTVVAGFFLLRILKHIQRN